MNKTILAVVLIAVVAAGAFAILGGDIADLNKASVTASGEGGTASGAGSYKVGETAVLTAVPNYGFKFAGWYEGYAQLSSQSVLSFEVKGSTDLTMKFDRLSFTISVSSDYPGGAIAGGGTYLYESSATLTAGVNPGYAFSGWYADGVRVSSGTATQYRVTADQSLEARYSIIHDASFDLKKTSSQAPTSLTLTSKYNVEVQSRTWTVKDLMTGGSLYKTNGNNNSYGVVSYGINSGKAVEIKQSVTYRDGYTVDSTQSTVVDEDVGRHYAWKYQEKEWYSPVTGGFNNKSATWDLTFSFGQYYKYHTQTRTNSYSTIGSYITTSDPKVSGLAAALSTFTSGMSDVDRVNCVLKFVQSLPYVYDIDNKGRTDYWNYPYETLWEQKGDCDDHAILFATLIKAMGYRVAILDLPGHMAVGVDVPGASGTYYLKNNVKYYYCEATAMVGGSWLNYYNVGEKPPEYSSATLYIV